MNAKGGCGKTTIATTLASYFSASGYNTAANRHGERSEGG
ncbi:MAG: ParA family protein [gamma proteobacterium symbiont of Phacoides pectinatus]